VGFTTIYSKRFKNLTALKGGVLNPTANKGLRIPVKLPKVTDRKWLSSPNLSNDKIYFVLAVIAYFLDTITPTNTFIF